jgi:hypothetical protein
MFRILVGKSLGKRPFGSPRKRRRKLYKLGYEILTALLICSTVFWDITLAAFFMLVYNLAYISTLNMEATYSYETLVDYQRTTHRYISRDRTLRIKQSNRWKEFSIHAM